MDAAIGSWKYDLGRSPGIKEACANAGKSDIIGCRKGDE